MAGTHHAALSRRAVLRLAALAGGHALVAGCAIRLPADDASAGAPTDPQPDEATMRGAEWLWQQQAEDGRFPSQTYGLLRSGQSLTPFALLALLRIPEAIPEQGPERAVNAMVKMLDPSGALGFATSAPDYPCYSTGLMASCLGALGAPGSKDVGRRLVAWLRAQQYRADAGWADHPAQGGWGMGEQAPRQPPDAGHVDLSMTRRVVEGLRAQGVSPDDPALVESLAFVHRCQTDDGSFFYSPVELALNKGERTAAGAPSGYGSATCDGYLCLRALNRAESTEAEGALAWLRSHHRVDANPGVSGGPMDAFAEAMRGYYRAGAAACFAAGGGPPDWRGELVAAIHAEQHEDGSWRNPNPLQKENDPIIATAFALSALVDAGARTAASRATFIDRGANTRL